MDRVRAVERGTVSFLIRADTLQTQTHGRCITHAVQVIHYLKSKERRLDDTKIQQLFYTESLRFPADNRSVTSPPQNGGCKERTR